MSRPPEPEAIDRVLARLAGSTFRRRFVLREADHREARAKGRAGLRRHARRFVGERLAPAAAPNDGRQTPMRGHPVFIAQHATATCCRGCLAKWHRIPPGRPLSEPERAYVEAVILRWITARVPDLPQRGADELPTLWDGGAGG